MSLEIRLPDVGEGVAEGEIVRWLIEEGSPVREDDPLVEVLTDKANVEIPSPAAGILARIAARPGQIVKVGELLAVLETGDAGAGGPRPEKTAAPPNASGGPPGPPHPPHNDVLATPAVRKLARDRGVDLSAVPGTGPEGRVTEDDVRRAAEGGGGAVSRPGTRDEERIPFRGKRRMAAKKMVLSKTTVPHALVVDEADVTELLSLRGRIREAASRHGVKITLLPFVVREVVKALRAHPALNATLDEAAGEIVRKKRYDIGMAVDAEDGLVVPVIRDAGGRTLVDLAREIERLAAGVREGTLPLSDLSGSTFTVTSIGSIGGLFSYPVINVPEAAILAVHRIAKRPAAKDDAVVVRDMVYVSLSFDHRLIDGGTATRFLNDVIRGLENPGPAEDPT